VRSRVGRGLGRAVVIGAAGVLLLAGFYKMQAHGDFALALFAQGVLPRAITPTVAWLVCTAEVGVGAATAWCVLQAGWVFVRCGAVGCAAVFPLFALYALWLVFDPPPAPAPCGCLPGSAEVASWWPIVVRNGLVASALSVVGLIGAPATRGAPARLAGAADA